MSPRLDFLLITRLQDNTGILTLNYVETSYILCSISISKKFNARTYNGLKLTTWVYNVTNNAIQLVAEDNFYDLDKQKFGFVFTAISFSGRNRKTS